MRFEFLIGLRYMRARRRERFVSLIAVISLAGVMLGTFALSVNLAVMSGFEEDLHRRLLAFTPHITIQTPEQATTRSRNPEGTNPRATRCRGRGALRFGSGFAGVGG